MSSIDFNDFSGIIYAFDWCPTSNQMVVTSTDLYLYIFSIENSSVTHIFKTDNIVYKIEWNEDIIFTNDNKATILHL